MMHRTTGTAMSFEEITKRAVAKMVDAANGDIFKILRIHEAKRALHMNRVVARYLAKIAH
jgi:hypothetical protein